MWIFEQGSRESSSMVDKVNRNDLLNYKNMTKKENRVPFELSYSRGKHSSNFKITSINS